MSSSSLWLSKRNETLIPVGVPTPWFTHFRPIPDNCLPCNGQNVDDMSSPLYGQQLPNLNGGAQLMGSMGDTGLEVDTFEVVPSNQPKGISCRWIVRIK